MLDRSERGGFDHCSVRETQTNEDWHRFAVLSLLVCGCTLGGAAAGGYAGNRLTNGSTTGTVDDAVAGGVVGYELGK
jgi:osmotically inducible lipoprotein OsmB